MPTEADVVAVIDDDPLIRQALERLLLALGYTVELYDSSEAFLQRAAACRAMCLIIDVQLGSNSGIELARQLAKAGLKFPIVFMTANDDKAVQRQAIEAGCVGYLVKPFATKLLMNILAESKIDEYSTAPTGPAVMRIEDGASDREHD